LGLGQPRGVTRPDTEAVEAVKQVGALAWPSASGNGVDRAALGHRGPQRPIAGDGGGDSALADGQQRPQQQEATQREPSREPRRPRNSIGVAGHGRSLGVSRGGSPASRDVGTSVVGWEERVNQAMIASPGSIMWAPVQIMWAGGLG
jgi:hypothetical protein